MKKKTSVASVFGLLLGIYFYIVSIVNRVLTIIVALNDNVDFKRILAYYLGDGTIIAIFSLFMIFYFGSNMKKTVE